MVTTVINETTGRKPRPLREPIGCPAHDMGIHRDPDESKQGEDIRGTMNLFLEKMLQLLLNSRPRGIVCLGIVVGALIINSY